MKVGQAQQIQNRAPVGAIKGGKPVVDAKAAVDGAWATIQQIQNRLTRELRAEDGIAGLALRDNGKIAVALKANQPYDEGEIARLVKGHLAAHGLKGASIEFVRPQIEPIPPHVVVDQAMASIRRVQDRMTTDMRPEDEIVGMRFDAGTVRVAVRANAFFSEAELKEAAAQHLANAGLPGATIELVRPAIQPIPTPVIPPPTASPMKAGVEAFAAHVAKVQSRITEELRIEDAVASVKLVGAKVELRLNPGSFERASVVAWAKEELAARGVTLPLVVKDA